MFFELALALFHNDSHDGNNNHDGDNSDHNGSIHVPFLLITDLRKR